MCGIIGWAEGPCDCCDHTAISRHDEYITKLNKERQEKIAKRARELLKEEYENLRETGKYSNIWINKKIRDLEV